MPQAIDNKRGLSDLLIRSGLRRFVLLCIGIVFGQFVLYGPSFVGKKILLPLDILSLPGMYIPVKAGEPVAQPHNELLIDPICEDEPARLFRNDELRAGRLPLWNPYQYAGVPSLSAFSPFALLGGLVRSPRVLPWIALLAALISGLGAYSFARRVLHVAPWPAIVAGWCYPVTGFFVLWQGLSLPYPVVWLPWLLCAVHHVVHRSSRWSIAFLSATTALVVISGHLDMAGQILVVSALFATWSLFDFFRHARSSKAVTRRVAALASGWLLGLMLASPELLPALDYVKTGSRMSQRGAGHEERSPVGIIALPQLVLPHIYGTSEKGSFAMLPAKEPNLLESTAAGFTGLIAALTIAPLAWSSRRHRGVATSLALIGLLGLSWCLNVPGIVNVMRLPGINMLSYNRFVFATSFALLALMTIGLDVISQGHWAWRRWYYLPIALIVGLGAWCIFRAFVLPTAIGVTLPQVIAQGHTVKWIDSMDAVRRVQSWFVTMYLSGAIVCLVALALWAGIRFKQTTRYVPLLGLLLLGELLWFGYGRATQSEPQLYYPSVPAFATIPLSPSQRILGYGCFPASLPQTQKLLDVRGYDGVDPARFVDLLNIAAAPNRETIDYGAVQFFVPRVIAMTPPSVRLPPVLDLLGVRYLVCTSKSAASSSEPFPAADYYVLENQSALPRTFVPRTVEVVPNDETRLAKLADPLFDPREIAYVEQPADLPASASGETEIVEANPQRVVLRAHMQTQGLVVLTDLWNTGWRASVDGKNVPIVRVDHTLRGVVAPAGESEIVLRYAPLSLKLGFSAAAIALLLLSILTLVKNSISGRA
jgi:hypothetical protein